MHSLLGLLIAERLILHRISVYVCTVSLSIDIVDYVNVYVVYNNIIINIYGLSIHYILCACARGSAQLRASPVHAPGSYASCTGPLERTSLDG